MVALNSPFLGGPFLGVEALSCGVVRKHQLRSEYSALFPGVYFPAGGQPTFAQRVEAAWLWSHRRGVIASCTAARLHGALWLDDGLPLELFWCNARTPPGIATSAVALAAGKTIDTGRAAGDLPGSHGVRPRAPSTAASRRRPPRRSRQCGVLR